MKELDPIINDPWTSLKRFTPARIALGRAGGSVPTKALLEFQLAHARARDAVHREVNFPELEKEFNAAGFTALTAASKAQDRDTYIQRPDLGRSLSDESAALLKKNQAGNGARISIIVADGLSAPAVQNHAAAVTASLWKMMQPEGWDMAPVILVKHGRVAIGDEIGAALETEMTAVLIGERPGLSSPDSLGIYFTYAPRVNRTDAERNCISNIREQGLGYEEAAHKLFYLMKEARRLKFSGVNLKENAPLLIEETVTQNRTGQ
ncbi:MAG: ethanolamine ammonia-lyase subunit EutC [bacterium]|nr:ethanolamine ammonia-lyase subunit EutC [bacterium]